MLAIKKLYTRYLHDVLIAAEAIMANKIKALLTALGIMFGVGAVISMLAIGRGAQQEVLEQIKMIGVNNIIITPRLQNDDEINANQDAFKQVRLSPGLTLADVRSIREVVPTIKNISPFINHKTNVLYNGKNMQSHLNGVLPSYFTSLNISMAKGHHFSGNHNEKAAAVCILGASVAQHLFNQTNPIGAHIKCGREWLKVIGVIEKRSATSSSPGSDIGDTNEKIIIPVKTLLMRFKDKSRVNADVMEGMMRGGDSFFAQSDNGNAGEMGHQLDKIIVQIKETPQLEETAKIIDRLLLRRHSGVNDYSITVPELLLKQQQKTNDIFNIVLGAIASISLIVGGIGIMNIMLASVWERIREIGTRQAIGATKKDITVQFLSESVLISVTGGMIGIFLGVLLAYIIQISADIKTIVSVYSVIIAFGVSVSVGVIFGYLPAKRAADQNPVESLRH